MNISCIYRITNKRTNQNYIGSTSDFSTRMWHHKKSLRNNSHHSRFLQQAWNEYGGHNFEFVLIERVPVNRLYEREQYYLDTMDASYNVLKTAGSSQGWSRKKRFIW